MKRVRVRLKLGDDEKEAVCNVPAHWSEYTVILAVEERFTDGTKVEFLRNSASDSPDLEWTEESEPALSLWDL
jgi:hypothetical protein